MCSLTPLFCFLRSLTFDPQGAEESDHDEKEKDEPVDATADPHRLLNVDLSK